MAVLCDTQPAARNVALLSRNSLNSTHLRACRRRRIRQAELVELLSIEMREGGDEPGAIGRLKHFALPTHSRVTFLYHIAAYSARACQ